MLKFEMKNRWRLGKLNMSKEWGAGADKHPPCFKAIA
jgi:hypothetical protein